jgi:hypothetical protein
MRAKDKVDGHVTEAFQFDGQDEGGQLRTILSVSPSVPEGHEVVVGSWRLYLPQTVGLPDGSTEVETEVVLRDEWLVWDADIEQWTIYPPKLYEKYFEDAPVEEEEPDEA